MALYVDYDAFLELAENTLPALRYLSSNTGTLLFNIANELAWEKFYHANGDPITEAERDDIEAIIAKALEELMTPSPLLGTIQYFAGQPQVGRWILCDGSSHAREDYPDLYAMLDANLIDDADTFHVPNLIETFVRGSDEFVGITGGSNEVTLTNDNMPEHRHVETVGHVHTYLAALPSIGAAITGVPVPSATSLSGAVTGAASVDLSYEGGGQPFEVLPSHVYMLVYMCAG